MKKVRNFIGALAIVLAFALSPAQVAAGPPTLVICELKANGLLFRVPLNVAIVLHARGIADCGVAT